MNVGHRDALEAASIHRRERNAGAQVALPRMRLPDDGAVPEHDVPEVAGGFGAQLERIVNGGEMAVGHRHVLRRAANPEGEARLEHDRVVPRLDAAVADPDVPAAVRIDPVRVSVQDGDTGDVHVVAAEEADVVVRRVGDGEVTNPDVTAPLEGDRLGAPSARAVPIDPTWTQDAHPGQVASLEQGEAEVRGFPIREGVVAERLDRIEIRVVLAGDQDRASVETEGDATAEAERAGTVLPGREGHRSPRWPDRVDGGLDRAGIDGAAVSSGAISADGSLRGLGGPNGSAGDEERREEPGGAPQESSSRVGHPLRLIVPADRNDRAMDGEGRRRVSKS